jgi:hypothetical protein
MLGCDGMLPVARAIESSQCTGSPAMPHLASQQRARPTDLGCSNETQVYGNVPAWERRNLDF